MRRRIYCLLAILWAVANSYAQSPPVNIRPLTIGDTIPADLEISNVYNYPVSKIRLSDLKGKLVILDFWATWCAACIKGFPKAEELQKQFKDKIQIIMVNSDTSDNAAKVSNFLAKQKQRTGQSLTLPYAVQNASFLEYFPHREIPHYVWVNEAGKIVGVTNADDVTAENIYALFQQNGKILFTKRDDLRFNADKPLLIDENGGDDPTGFIYRSIITNSIPKLGSFIGRHTTSNNGINRMYLTNYPLIAFLQLAYPDVFTIPLNRLVLETTIETAQIFKENKEYCYELITSETTEDKAIQFLREDIKRTFNVEAKLEKRRMKCYLLASNNKIKKSKTSGKEPSFDLDNMTLAPYLQNQPVSKLSTYIGKLLKTPVIYSTENDTNIDVQFPTDIQKYSLTELQAFLKAIGFDLIETEKEIEAIVIISTK